MARVHPKGNLEVSGLLARFSGHCLYFCMVGMCWTDFASASWRTEFDKELPCHCAEFFPLRWNIIFVIDRLNGADRLTSAAINALVRLDVEHAIAFIDAIDRAFLDTRLVLDIDARFCNYICHGLTPIDATSEGH